MSERERGLRKAGLLTVAIAAVGVAGTVTMAQLAHAATDASANGTSSSSTDTSGSSSGSSGSSSGWSPSSPSVSTGGGSAHATSGGS